MPKILLQEEISLKLADQIAKEFPQYTFIDKCQDPYDWHAVEIIYGHRLTVEELSLAARLKWIHCPSVDTDELCVEALKQRSDIFLSLGGRFNVTQIGEYVIGAILAYSKQFFKWQLTPKNAEEFQQWPLKETMWTLKDRTLLQIGLGSVGTEIVKMANFFGMKTWGIRTRNSFHPYCKKTFSIQDLHSLLPTADVVSIAIPRKGLKTILFGKEEFKLMKPDSLFIVTGSAEPVDEKALTQAAKSGKFRGIVLDAFTQNPFLEDSPLKDLSDALLTPMVSGIPQLAEAPSLKMFLRNLRIYTTGRYQEMKNLSSIS